MPGFTLFYTTSVFTLMILYDSLSPEHFYCTLVYIRKFEISVQMADRYAHGKIKGLLSGLVIQPRRGPH
jgi:hypothetical protein